MDLVTDQWRGKPPRGVNGRALLPVGWTEGSSRLPCDLRVDDPPQGGKTQNEHFPDMLRTAKERGLAPEDGLRDRWESAVEKLTRLVAVGWFFLTRLKSQRLVNPDGAGKRPLEEGNLPPEGRVGPLRGVGFVRGFRTGSHDGGAEDGATTDLERTEEKRKELDGRGGGSEGEHRALQPCWGVENAQGRQAVSLLRPWLLAVRAFLWLEG